MLKYLDISGNRIRHLNNSVFRKQGELQTLILSGNMLQSLEPGLLSDCTNLRNLDLSNNNIDQLDPLVFQNTLTSTNRQSHQVSKLKHINLAQNKIRSFNFELYFPTSNNSDTSTQTFQLAYLNISSNCLYSVDAASAIWLVHTTTVIDLTGNPGACECWGLGKARGEEQHEPPLPCALVDHSREDRCEVIGSTCLDTRAVTSTVLPDSDNGSEKTSVVTDSITTGSAGCSGSAEDTDTSLVTTLFAVNGVLLVCTAVGGGFILVQVLKKQRKSSKVTEHFDAHIPLTEIDSSNPMDSSPNSKTVDARTGHVYETIN
jgi:Leucine-rich repeat (LRR) protein